jgi:hypothetical protein
MTNYLFRNGYPYYKLNEHEGFSIEICNAFHIKDNMIIHKWDFNSAGPESFPREWFRQIWEDLKANSFTYREDQWSSEYYSILGERVVQWCDDRHENSYFIYPSSPLKGYEQDASLPAEVRQWLKTQVKNIVRTEIPGPPENDQINDPPCR